VGEGRNFPSGCEGVEECGCLCAVDLGAEEKVSFRFRGKVPKRQIYIRQRANPYFPGFVPLFLMKYTVFDPTCHIRLVYTDFN
jgi:hypothetical protein